MLLKYILCVSLLISTTVFASEPMVLKVEDIYDGDTFSIELPLPPPLNKAYIRIRGIDTPERGARAKCPLEHQKSMEALNRVKQLIPIKSSVTVTDYDWDKYGGRINANVISNGVDVGRDLIKLGLAVPYSGQGAKKDWCSTP